MPKLEIVGPAYQDDTLPVSAQECINWIPEVVEVTGARNVVALKDAPGHERWEEVDADDLTQGGRGLFSTEVLAGSTLTNRYQNRAYGVFGSKLAIFGEDGFLEFASGAPLQGAGVVQFAFNGSSLLIYAQGTFPKLYAYNMAPVSAVAASLQLGQLEYTALTAGTAGNDITVEYENPETTDSTLSVGVSGSDIVVTLATFGNDRGNHSASGNLFPTTGGSGTGGSVLKNDSWTISVSGTLGGTAVVVGDTIRALTNAPGQIASNWIINGTVSISTADEIKAEIEATPAAAALVNVAVDGLGTQVETAVDATNLEGGTAAVAQSIYDITTTLPFAPGGVTFVNGYYVVPEFGGQRFCISGLNNYTFSGLDFATAESATDTLLRAFEYQGDLLLFGAKSIEQWRNTGASPFPFERSNGATLDLGLGARLAIAKIDNSYIWLSPDGIVYEGGKRVSTYAIEQDIVSEDFSNAVGFSYRDKGHWFFVLHLDGAVSAQQRKTWVFDAATRLWHRRQTKDQPNWRILHYAKLGQRHLGTSRVLSDPIPVYQLSDQYKVEHDVELVSERVTAYITEDQKPLFQSSLELIMNTGNAAQTGTVSETDPVVELRYSDDAGRTWCDWKQRAMGKIGEYRKRVKFKRLGRFRVRTFHIRVSDPVRRELILATVEGASGIDGASQ